ncbi:MAG: hypothetical protein BroJett033_8110 [Chloroflexota bacterium]|nr:MAG: hypothetical protein BroJett033_8110 [Chloroflexota bacterium]
MSKRREAPKAEMWRADDENATSLAQVADEIYGPSAGPTLESGRVVARPLPIGQLWADAKQPRRAVPASVRLHWDGDPEQVPPLLDAWRQAAERLAGVAIAPLAIIEAQGEGLAVDEWPALARDFVELCRLAASIHANGLLNPINVAQVGSRKVIVAGERRWLAYWLLAGYTQEDRWVRIPAQMVSDVDHVWKQAAENTARRQLNAIGMARQLALLIMASRKDDGYRAFEDVVQPGVCDRRYYAQVADGSVHRIPAGMGERIQAAMGLSMTQLSQYRRLLCLTDDEQVNDALWLRGDVEDWAERALRELSTLTTVKVREIVTGPDEWTLDSLRELATLTAVKVREGRTGPDEWALDDPHEAATLTAVKVREGVTEPRYPVSERAPALQYVPYDTGDAVIAPGGQVGRVLGVSGGMARVRLENGATPLIAIGRLRRVAAEARERWPEGTEVGMAVEVIHTGEVGVVERRFTDDAGRRFLHVNISGYGGAKALEEVRVLELTWEDFLRQEADEDGIELLEPSVATDKTDSVWHAGLPARPVVVALQQYARRVNNVAALDAITDLLALTTGDMRGLADADSFADEIGPRYETVMNCMVDAMHSLFDLLEVAHED